MTTRFRIDIGRTARRQIHELSAWWRLNRTAAPTAVSDDLARVFRLILNQPHIGPRAFDVELSRVRRIHLSRIGHYLYYRIRDDEAVIEVLAIWSDSRGEAPPL